VHALSNVCHVDVERISKRKPGEVVFLLRQQLSFYLVAYEWNYLSHVHVNINYKYTLF